MSKQSSFCIWYLILTNFYNFKYTHTALSIHAGEAAEILSIILMLHDPHMSEGGWRQQVHGGGDPVRVLGQLREDGEGVASTTCNDIVKNTALTPSAVSVTLRPGCRQRSASWPRPPRSTAPPRHSPPGGCRSRPACRCSQYWHQLTFIISRYIH